MAQLVDCRGMACPQPVINTKAALAAGDDDVMTIVDNEAAATNVTRMAQKLGWAVSQERREDEIYVHMSRGAAAVRPQAISAEPTGPSAGPTVLLVTSDRLGRGDDELGDILMRSFFHAMLELEELPATTIFLNSGVKLAVEGSPVLDDLKALASRGVEIGSCGTCLKFYGLTERLGVGSITNMYAILETLTAAGGVLSL